MEVLHSGFHTLSKCVRIIISKCNTFIFSPIVMNVYRLML